MIPAYLEGMLSDRDRRWFERKLRASDACRDELAAYRKTLQLSLRLKVDYPSPAALEEFLPRLYERIAQATTEEPERVAETPQASGWKSWGWDALIGSIGGTLCGAACATLIVAFGVFDGITPNNATETPPVTERVAPATDSRWLPAPDATVEQAANTTEAVNVDDLLNGQRTPMDLYGEPTTPVPTSY